ncbi:PREDICTED: MLP-like protein 28-like [Fragaria vesca subsp. vesca]|uniref:Ripening-induced protein n=1 Tax=Fragaria vesca TaxID=57918 RepID=O23942_FRAVE|nr:MLP-like protein 28-like [Fragaria vesca]CAA04770.1 ripening-induced protein [Fragaria vesca]
MSLQGKVEAEFEITAPADKFYNIFKIEAHLVPNTSQTGSITGVAVHEGDWETDGSIKIWNYAIEGEVGTFKERVELDEVNKTITLNGLEGDVFQYYKSFKPIYQFTQKDEGSSIAKVSIEYEKLSEEVAAPDKYIRLMTNIVKDLDAHFVKA